MDFATFKESAVAVFPFPVIKMSPGSALIASQEGETANKYIRAVLLLKKTTMNLQACAF